jgi:hypothetical protein
MSLSSKSVDLNEDEYVNITVSHAVSPDPCATPEAENNVDASKTSERQNTIVFPDCFVAGKLPSSSSSKTISHDDILNFNKKSGKIDKDLKLSDLTVLLKTKAREDKEHEARLATLVKNEQERLHAQQDLFAKAQDEYAAMMIPPPKPEERKPEVRAPGIKETFYQ